MVNGQYWKIMGWRMKGKAKKEENKIETIRGIVSSLLKQWKRASDDWAQTRQRQKWQRWIYGRIIKQWTNLF